MALSYDDTLFPLLWYRFVDEATEADASAFMALNRPMLERGQREGVRTLSFIDGLGISSVGASTRQQFGAYSKRMREEGLAQVSAGGVVLVSSPLVRGAITAIGWISSSAMENTKVAKDVRAGLDQARKLFAAADQPLDEQLVSRLLSAHYADAA